MTEQEALTEATRLITQDARRKFIAGYTREMREFEVRMTEARYSMDANKLAPLVKLHAEVTELRDKQIRAFDASVLFGETTWRGILCLRNRPPPPAVEPARLNNPRESSLWDRWFGFPRRSP